MAFSPVHNGSVITHQRLAATLLFSQTCPRLVPLSYPSRRGAASMMCEGLNSLFSTVQSYQ
ncbi:hypothetical protein HBI60_152770 [Parastagonospora nodorum]|nr:hypothetical protein HBH85_203190 [Parastagonospora nodorum]KAH6199963.1 hypothetical protein HBI53_156450 [Parastagonospora nodorum]KAH6393125.1 hypothetical protein HBI60_152770 [Parastagonospora nodorum]